MGCRLSEIGRRKFRGQIHRRTRPAHRPSKVLTCIGKLAFSNAENRTKVLLNYFKKNEISQRGRPIRLNLDILRAESASELSRALRELLPEGLSLQDRNTWIFDRFRACKDSPSGRNPRRLRIQSKSDLPVLSSLLWVAATSAHI